MLLGSDLNSWFFPVEALPLGVQSVVALRFALGVHPYGLRWTGRLSVIVLFCHFPSDIDVLLGQLWQIGLGWTTLAHVFVVMGCFSGPRMAVLSPRSPGHSSG